MEVVSIVSSGDEAAVEVDELSLGTPVTVTEEIGVVASSSSSTAKSDDFISVVLPGTLLVDEDRSSNLGVVVVILRTFRRGLKPKK